MSKHLLISAAIFIFLIIGTTFLILYGTGYRFEFDEQSQAPSVSKTGLLVATSIPDGASVFIDDQLATATDNTLNLKPGEYKVKIVKEGFLPWEKEITIQEKIVTKAEALLFPLAPKLEGITTLGVTNPVINPSGLKIAYTVASQSARKNGIYVLDMSQLFVLTLQSVSKQLADDTIFEFSQAGLSWTPDGEDIIATTSAGIIANTYLIRSNQNTAPRNVTSLLPSLNESWSLELLEKERARRAGLKPLLQKTIDQNFKILSWSPDETKILYEASRSATLSLVTKPRLIGIDIKREDRSIEEGKIYVYDIKEDINFKILDTLKFSCDLADSECRMPLSWFPDSKHLIYVSDKKINILEYDGENKTTIYAGPFVDNYVFPWPNGSKLVILTNLNNSQIPNNLYTISLK